MEQQKTLELKGYLYKNKSKNNVKQPEHKGKVTVNGKEYLMAAWEKQDKNGEIFWSISLTDPDTLPKKENNPSNAQQNYNQSNSRPAETATQSNDLHDDTLQKMHDDQMLDDIWEDLNKMSD